MGTQKKKCLFMVQGEGRGHMTQSISMKQILKDVGIDVCEVLIGKSRHRQIPGFYYRKINTAVSEMNSPAMSMDKNYRSVKPFYTFINSVSRFPQYLKSLKLIDKKIKQHKPDIIINFFEPLCGLYYMLYRPKINIVSVAHHYMFLHSDYTLPDNKYISNASLRIYTRLTGFGSKQKLALSFYPFRNDLSKAIYPVPPLLRNEVLNHISGTGNYLLVYLLNNGYMEDIIKWHRQNLDIMLHCFTERKGMSNIEYHDATLCFHSLNDTKFIAMMANAKGVVTTSGFESVCEAMYLGKPVLTIPVQGHHEQFCNSLDAAKTRLSMRSDKFDLGPFLNYADKYLGNNSEFSEWVDKSHEIIANHLSKLLNIEGSSSKTKFKKAM